MRKVDKIHLLGSIQLPQAYIFDVFGTLTDWRTSISREVRSVFPDVDATAFADAWRGEYQPAMERIRSGNRGYVPLDDIHSENLSVVMKRFDLAQLSPDAHNALARAWERLDTWPDVVPGLGALKDRAIIAPCSNGSIALMTNLAKHAGLPWDCILGADLAQNYKPKPEVYRTCCNALRLDPSDVMMVAAHNDDLVAASGAGLQTAFIPRPTEHGTGQNIDLEPTGDWTAVVAELTELPELNV